MHKIPREYTHDAILISAYNNGYRDGYDGDVFPPKMKTDEERLAYANGRREGKLKRRKENEEIDG